MIKAADTYQFPITASDFFQEVEDEYLLKGKVIRNDEKYSAYCSALKYLVEYEKSSDDIMSIHADDPRKPYTCHSMSIDFGTNCFEDNKLNLFTKIIRNFESMDIITNEDGNVTTIVMLWDIYKAND